METDYSSYSFPALIDMLENDTDYKVNCELARRIVDNNKRAVNFYINVLSLPIITHIERSIMYRDILSDFYEFLSNPFNYETKKSEWRKVSLYKGETCRLDSYTSIITVRHFCKVAEKERKNNHVEEDTVKRIDYKSLLEYLECENVTEIQEGSKLWKIGKAFHNLCERDKMVIYYLEVEKKSALEAWPLLYDYIKPRAIEGLTSEEVKQGWTDRQKQNAISLIKGRAIALLKKYYNKM